MNCLVVAGEKSGEEHCLSFLDDLKEKKPELNFFGVGGDRLQSKGVDLIYHLNDFSSWGYSEVFKKIPFYIEATNRLVEEVIKRKCQYAILIDFQTFNMRLAKKLKAIGVKVLYVVAPQAWAWKSWRVNELRTSVDELFTIIPFEKEWFANRGVPNITSIDHPVYTKFHHDLAQYDRPLSGLSGKEINLLILPGSRNFEVKELLGTFLRISKKLKNHFKIKVSIVQSESVSTTYFDFYRELFDTIYPSEQVVEAIKNADICLAASGTVTLTCGLFELPTVVCYRTSRLNQLIYECFVKYRGPISLNNIVHNEIIFPEFVQDDLEEGEIYKILISWIQSDSNYIEMVKRLKETKKLVQGECSNLGHHFSKIME